MPYIDINPYGSSVLERANLDIWSDNEQGVIDYNKISNYFEMTAVRRITIKGKEHQMLEDMRPCTISDFSRVNFKPD